MKRILLALICTLAVVGCASQKALLAEAQTPEEKAYALYGSFVVYEEVAATVVQDATTPASVKDALKKVDETAKPAADAMQDAARTVIKVQAQLAAGGTPEQKLQVVTDNLISWIVEAEPKIVALQCAVNPKLAACKG